MYSPYDNYLDQAYQEGNLGNTWEGKDNYFTPGKIAAAMTAGTIGLGTLGTAALLSRRAYSNITRNNPGFASKLSKISNSDFYHGIINPLNQVRDFVPTFRRMNGMDQALSMKFGNGQTGIPMPGFMANKITNKAVREAISPGGSGKVLSEMDVSPRFGIRMPMMMPLMFGMGIMSEQAVNNHPSAIATGIARTSLSLGGAAVGQGIGAAVGSMIFPILGTTIGAVAGGMIGGTIGDSVIDVAKWLKHKGREWTRSNLGGNFSDSRMGYTMRQRSLNAISTSQFNVRANLGSEATRLATGY